MVEPDWNPDTGGRSLAEILREAGIESASRSGRRRRWDDPDEAGLRQRRAEAAAAGRTEYGRRKSDQAADEARPAPERRETRERRAIPERHEIAERHEAVERRQVPDRREVRRPVPGPATAAIPGLRPDRKPGVPHPSAPLPGTPFRDERAEERAEERRAEERVPEQAAQRTPRRATVVESHPVTGPIPVVRAGNDLDADLDDESTPQESALAWLRFAGELIIALAAGVGVFFAATLLWENLPHVAVLLAPLAVTGLVTGVGVWRQRQGREPVGPRLLAILVFAGTLLTIAPAAGLLAGS
jgi:hypothetical protein